MKRFFTNKGFSAVELVLGGAMLGGLSLMVSAGSVVAKRSMANITRTSAFVKIESSFTEAIASQFESNVNDSSPVGCGKGLNPVFNMPNLGTATITNDVVLPELLGSELTEAKLAAERCRNLPLFGSGGNTPLTQSSPGSFSFCVKFQKTASQLPPSHFLSSEWAFAEVRVNLVNTKSSHDVFAGPFLSCLNYRMNESSGISIFYRAYWHPVGDSKNYSSTDGRVLYPKTGSSGPVLFNLVAKHSNKCVENPGSSLNNSVQLQQYQCLGPSAENQVWKLYPVGTSYQVVSKGNSKCLAIEGSSSANGARVIQSDCLNSASNQLWNLNEVGEGYFQLKPQLAAASTKCMDVNMASMANGSKIQIWDCLSGNDAQKFKVSTPESLIPAGFFTYHQAKHYSDGFGGYCRFVSNEQYIAQGGPSNGGTIYDAMPNSMRFNGDCLLAPGYFFYNGKRYYSNGQGHYCQLDTNDQWVAHGGPSSGSLTFPVLPNGMILDGHCLTRGQRYVIYLYRLFLGRFTHVSEIAGWTSTLNIDDTNSRDSIVKHIVGSDEFFSRYPDKWAFTAILYSLLLGRTPDPVGQNSWVNSMAQGMTRASVVSGFMNSDEYKMRAGVYDPMYGIPATYFKSGTIINYSNGQFQYCYFTSWERWKAAGGWDDTSNMPRFDTIPNGMMVAGPCN